MSVDQLTAFANEIQQGLLLEAEVEGAEQLRSEAFTRYLVDVLVEAGELEEATPCHLNDRGIDVHAYGVEDDDTLNLVGTIYTGDMPPPSVPASDVSRAFKRLEAFWRRCLEQPYHERLEESSDAYDMALHVHQVANRVKRLRLFVITDGRTAAPLVDLETVDGIEIRRSVWDITRLHRLETSGQPREPIEIDFVDRFGGPLPCLVSRADNKDYDVMLAVFPGSWLAEIYHEFGARLLELNVRSFLQATGKVNRGIRDTLRDEPSRFLAYNNGISATASSVELVEQNGTRAIKSMRDLQIVNGGQTTASIHRARVAGHQLEDVEVQAKVTVVNGERLDEIVPLISRYANSQNKVSEADLRANDPFHVEIESLSRTVWTPATPSGHQTRWFYERARGQYRDELSRAGSPARQRAWKTQHPSNQRFTKTDLAKFENAWAQLPHEVSRGAQKNFTVFMTGLAQNHVKTSVEYFHRLVAKAILWKTTERLVSDQQFGGYRANLVAYSIAKLSHATAQRVDLNQIWEQQSLDAALEDALVALSHISWRVLVDLAPAGANITEWAKQERCWRTMREQEWAVPASVTAGLVVLGGSRGAVSVDPDDDPSVATCSELGGEGWLALSNWAKQTSNLSPWQRKLAYDIGVRMMRGRPPSVKQAQYGARILEEAQRLGFATPPASS